MKRFLIIGSWDRKVPWSSMCKWENQRGWWNDSSLVWRPENHGANGATPRPRPKTRESRGATALNPGTQRFKNQEPRLKTGKDVCSSYKRQSLSFLHLFVLFWFSKDWMVSIHIGEGRSFILSPLIQMLVSSENNPHRHIKK